MPLIPEFRKQREMNLCEFKVSMVYRLNFRTSKNTQRNLVLKNQKKNKYNVSKRQ